MAQDMIDIFGLVVATVIGAATVYIAWMQTRIADEQNKISESLRSIEEHRDRPYLILRAIEDVNEDEREAAGHQPDGSDVEVQVGIQNLGGTAAWNIKVQMIRIYAMSYTAERPVWDDEYEMESKDLIEADVPADAWFDVVCDSNISTCDSCIEVLQPNEAAWLNVSFHTRHVVQEITGGEVLSGIRDGRDRLNVAWQTARHSRIPVPTSDQISFYHREIGKELVGKGSKYGDWLNRPINEFLDAVGEADVG